jgi:malate dehydrogenase (oxaloacetate-decarboxylating)(NADP+)
MVYASAAGLAAALTEDEIARGNLYPDIHRVREVAAVVARDVIRAAQKEGVDRNKLLQFLSDSELLDYIKGKQYDPKVVHISRPTSRSGSPDHGNRGRSHL